MTKELEALERIESTTISSRVGDWGMEYKHVKDLASTKPYFDTLRTALTELEQHKLWLADLQKLYSEAQLELDRLRHAPTADEVCEALKEYCNPYETPMYNAETKEFILFTKVGHTNATCYFEGGRIWFVPTYPPHIINLISRFYMGVDSK